MYSDINHKNSVEKTAKELGVSKDLVHSIGIEIFRFVEEQMKIGSHSIRLFSLGLFKVNTRRSKEERLAYNEQLKKLKEEQDGK
jgi:hypothetical protein